MTELPGNGEIRVVTHCSYPIGLLHTHILTQLHIHLHTRELIVLSVQAGISRRQAAGAELGRLCYINAAAVCHVVLFTAKDEPATREEPGRTAADHIKVKYMELLNFLQHVQPQKILSCPPL